MKKQEEMFLAEMGIHTQVIIEGDYTAKYKLTDLLKKYAEQCNTPDEGRREEYHCELYEFGRCESPCARQCESCFWMESKR